MCPSSIPRFHRCNSVSTPSSSCVRAFVASPRVHLYQSVVGYSSSFVCMRFRRTKPPRQPLSARPLAPIRASMPSSRVYRSLPVSITLGWVYYYHRKATAFVVPFILRLFSRLALDSSGMLPRSIPRIPLPAPPRPFASHLVLCSCTITPKKQNNPRNRSYLCAIGTMVYKQRRNKCSRFADNILHRGQNNKMDLKETRQTTRNDLYTELQG